MNPSQSLAGQVAIISGGLGDIGSAIALELARRGADVAIGDVRSDEAAQPLLAGLNELGRRGRYDTVDVTDHSRVVDWVRAVEANLGAPTLIIPNAAVVALASVCEITPEQWNRELRVNLDGAFHLAQTAALRLRALHRPGRIVFIGSWVAHAPLVTIPAYCVSKAALRMLCKVMALELAGHGILVNEVAPGYVDAGLSGAVWKKHPEQRAQAQANVPIHQLSTPGDVALQVAHLCDPLTQHITGTSILIDGGISLTNVALAGKDKR